MAIKATSFNILTWVHTPCFNQLNYSSHPQVDVKLVIFSLIMLMIPPGKIELTNSVNRIHIKLQITKFTNQLSLTSCPKKLYKLIIDCERNIGLEPIIMATLNNAI